jgi:hypothetical protein
VRVKETSISHILLFIDQVFMYLLRRTPYFLYQRIHSATCHFLLLAARGDLVDLQNNTCPARIYIRIEAYVHQEISRIDLMLIHR